MTMNQLKGPQTPPLYDTLIGLKQDVMRSLRCCVPAKVTAVNLVQNTIDAQISLLQLNNNGSSSSYPPLLGCPIVTLQGGGMAVSMPIKVGDSCLIFFSDRCIDAWFKTGSPQPLPNLRMHDLSDGFALVGVNSLNSILALSLLVGEGGIADAQARVAIDSVTHKIAISNNSEQLYTLLTNLITTLTTIATVPGGGPLNAASIAALTTYIVRIANLLKP